MVAFRAVISLPAKDGDSLARAVSAPSAGEAPDQTLSFFL